MTIHDWLALAVLLAGLTLCVGLYVRFRRRRLDPGPAVNDLVRQLAHVKRVPSMMKVLSPPESLTARLIESLMESAVQPWWLDYLTHVAFRRCHDQLRRLRRVYSAVTLAYAALMGCLILLLWSTEGGIWVISITAVLLWFAELSALEITSNLRNEIACIPPGLLLLRQALYSWARYLPPHLAHLEFRSIWKMEEIVRQG